MKNSLSNRLSFQVIFIVCFLASGFLYAATYDASGTWEVKTSDHYDSCDELTSSMTFEVTIEQSGDSFTIYSDDEDERITGEISGASYSYSNNYTEDGGTTDEESTFTLTSNSSGSGTVSWEWADDSYANKCQGTFDFTMTKKGSSGSTGDDDVNDDDTDDKDDEDEDEDDDKVCFIGSSLFGLK